MTDQITPEQKEFLEKSKKHQQDKVEELAYKVLGVALNKNIPIFDLPYYTLQRARQIINEGMANVDFTNKKLTAARKKFMKECLKELKTKLPEEKESKGAGDETEQRNEMCEPIAREIVNMLLDEDLIFSDEDFFDFILKEEEGVPLKTAVIGYANNLDDKLLMVISEHWRRSNAHLWGVEKERITFKMLDDILKKI